MPVTIGCSNGPRPRPTNSTVLSNIVSTIYTRIDQGINLEPLGDHRHRQVNSEKRQTGKDHAILRAIESRLPNDPVDPQRHDVRQNQIHYRRQAGIVGIGQERTKP